LTLAVNSFYFGEPWLTFFLQEFSIEIPDEAADAITSST